MSNFASIFVSAVVLLSLLSYILLLWGTSKMKTGKKNTEDMGHEWDGIKELNSPLPKWWFYTFAGLTIWAIGFVFYYPALGNYKGIGDWTEAKQYEEEVQATNKKYDEYYESITTGTIAEMAKNPKTLQTGRRLFLNNCAVCHGSAAVGTQGFPNLTDKDWLFGGSVEAIEQSIAEGRNGLMPPQAQGLKDFAKASGLNPDTVVDDVTEYVMSLSGRGKENAAGKQAYALCAACHKPDGTGMHALGAPNLTDDIWLYDSGELSDESLRSTIMQSIEEGRTGVMPAHKEILSKEKIRTLAAYIYSLSNQ